MCGFHVLDAMYATPHTREVAATRRVVIVAYDDVQALDVTGPHEVFAGSGRLVERRTGTAGYQVEVVAVRPGPVRTESGLQLVAAAIDAGRPIDTLIVPGGDGARRCDDVLTAAIGELAAGARRVVGVCSGAFLLAAAGLLDGRRATTHWARAARLAAEHPAVDVDPDPIWIRDGNVWTSAGVTAGLDVALALVEDDHGIEVAETCARWLVMFLRRPGTQSQFAAPVWRARSRDEPIRRAQELIEAEPAADHRLRVLAARVGLSERHLLRRFTAELATSPARYVAAARVEAARRELEEGGDTVAAIAGRVGFGTAESMRRTFLRDVGASPDDYRRRFTHQRKDVS